jgi:hypothetical protein
VSSIVAFVIVVVIDLLLSFVPRVVLLKRWRDRQSEFIHSDQELSVVPNPLERPGEAPNVWYD